MQGIVQGAKEAELMMNELANLLQCQSGAIEVNQSNPHVKSCENDVCYIRLSFVLFLEGKTFIRGSMTRSIGNKWSWSFNHSSQLRTAFNSQRRQYDTMYEALNNMSDYIFIERKWKRRVFSNEE